MEKKIILLIVGMFLLVSTVSAIEFVDLEGQIVQRNALRNVNFSDYTYQQLGCRVDSRGISIPYYRISASCLTLENVDINRVRVIRENFASEFLILDFINCARANGLRTCLTDFRNYLWNMLRDGAEVRRTKILHELETINDIVPSWFNDIGF